MNEQEKLNGICFWLIKNLCVDTNAYKGTITQENVTYKGKKLGTYKITVEKIT